jgi:hypothetical protein
MSVEDTGVTNVTALQTGEVNTLDTPQPAGLVAPPTQMGSWALQQAPWPTVWPPSPAPYPPSTGPGVVPWRMWNRVMAVRPYITDPPPCPVVVSYYGYPPNLQF